MATENPNGQNDDPKNDNIGENAGDSQLSKGSTPNVQDKPDDTRVDTVTPDNDSGTPGPSTDESSNKQSDGGPSTENL
ncbi:hypothetical protein [Mucilaginibacter lacusdianchii]|uniref:hypothetical protein n=1 Tax=Mucilaginibacter lacusdianchii TaxID=2684211 RepID=UPI00131E7D58|nr:hypothetical protein [Mucilaginibacter sp. JXJ CY 39]